VVQVIQSLNSKSSPFKSKSKSSKIVLESDLSPSPRLESYNSACWNCPQTTDRLHSIYSVLLARDWRIQGKRRGYAPNHEYKGVQYFFMLRLQNGQTPTVVILSQSKILAKHLLPVATLRYQQATASSFFGRSENAKSRFRDSIFIRFKFFLKCMGLICWSDVRNLL